MMIGERVPAIFEAAFEYDGIRIRVDVLERLAHGTTDTPTWHLILQVFSAVAGLRPAIWISKR